MTAPGAPGQRNGSTPVSLDGQSRKNDLSPICSRGWGMGMADCQAVSISLNDAPVPPPQPANGAYLDGTFHPLPPHCPACGQPFAVNHVLQITSDRPWWRHTDCTNPTLAEPDDDHEYALRNMVG